jgi:hypothetical protein
VAQRRGRLRPGSRSTGPRSGRRLAPSPDGRQLLLQVDDNYFCRSPGRREPVQAVPRTCHEAVLGRPSISRRLAARVDCRRGGARSHGDEQGPTCGSYATGGLWRLWRGVDCDEVVKRPHPAALRDPLQHAVTVRSTRSRPWMWSAQSCVDDGTRSTDGGRGAWRPRGMECHETCRARRSCKRCSTLSPSCIAPSMPPPSSSWYKTGGSMPYKSHPTRNQENKSSSSGSG